MNFQALRAAIKKGEIDTVVVGCPDVFGRIIGKRVAAPFFLDQVAGHSMHGCNYLLTVDIEMEPMEGYKLANWEQGFGDFELRVDAATLRRLPWQEGTAMVLADFYHSDGRRVEEAPRTVLRRQAERLAKRRLSCQIASELEFFLFHDSYPEAFAKGYRDLKPSSDYRIDYHTMQPARDEDFFRRVRSKLLEAGVPVESSKGEWGRGQHEINLVHAEPVAMADQHLLFKQGVKEMAAQQGRAVSFMAKPSISEPGNSCHIHTSLWQGRRNAFWDPRRREGTKLFRQFLGGLLKYSREFCYFFAPTINSYKRFQPGSWAPTRLAWAHDNRTVGFRVVGAGNSFRIENRMPGGDANPYLAFAATLAAGWAGVTEELDCGEAYEGNAYVDSSLLALPRTLEEAVALLQQSKIAREALGEEVVEFYVHTGELEVRAFHKAVTDWEMIRYFERI